MKKTVTIGIPAHNEEKNIGSLLDAILSQKGDNFILEKIIVACDGCTDNTANIVQKLAQKHSLIHLINDGKRLGKSERMNHFYQTLQSDIFITFDADATLGNDCVISELVKAFTDEKVGLVGGRVVPLPQKTFIGKIIEAHEYFWTQVIKSINHGDNLQSHTGPMSAGSKAFLKSVERPKSIIADDHFLFLEALKNGFTYKSAKNAHVYIKVPTTFNDYMKQTTRFLDSAEQIKKHFGDLAETHYHIAVSKKLRGYFLALLKYPIYLPLSLVLNAVQRTLEPMYREKSTRGTWREVASTK